MDYKEDYVSYEQAKRLKELGFPQAMTGGYYSEICKEEVRGKLFLDRPVVSTMYAAPTLYIVQKWLREEHNVDITISVSKRTLNGKKLYYMIIDMGYSELAKGNDTFRGNLISLQRGGYDVYEEVLADAISYILNTPAQFADKLKEEFKAEMERYALRNAISK